VVDRIGAFGEQFFDVVVWQRETQIPSDGQEDNFRFEGRHLNRPEIERTSDIRSGYQPDAEN
jgi:hypothetical protein